VKDQHLAYVIVKLLADDQNTIPYRPPIARVYRDHFTRGAINAAIFLQQSIYWWGRVWKSHPSFMPFFKFNLPSPEHPAYKPGQSWVEELAMSERELLSARKKVGLKKLQGVPLTQALQVAANQQVNRLPRPVIYWTNAARLTYYTICPPALLNILSLAYPQEDIDLLTQDIMLTCETSVSKPAKRRLPNLRNVGYLTCETSVTKQRLQQRSPETTQQQQGVDVDDAWSLADSFNPEQNAAFQELLGLAMTPKRAAELVISHPPVQVQAAVDKAADEEADNPAGFVIWLLAHEDTLLPIKPYRYDGSQEQPIPEPVDVDAILGVDA
jgi:hypothetical protein